jgi:hypothetical protein
MTLGAIATATPAANGLAKKQAGRKAAPRKAAAPAAMASATAGPVDVIDRVFKLADETGGMGPLKRLVDRLAGVQGRGTLSPPGHSSCSTSAVTSW